MGKLLSITHLVETKAAFVHPTKKCFPWPALGRCSVVTKSTITLFTYARGGLENKHTPAVFHQPAFWCNHLTTHDALCNLRSRISKYEVILSRFHTRKGQSLLQ